MIYNILYSDQCTDLHWCFRKVTETSVYREKKDPHDCFMVSSIQ